MDSFNPTSIYNLPPCSDGSCAAGFTGGATGTVPGSLASGTMAGSSAGTMMNPMPSIGQSATPFPSIEDIAGYNYLSPQQREQQRNQLSQAGNFQFRGNPRSMVQSQSQAGAGVGGGTGGVLAPVSPSTQPMPMTAESLQYMNGFLRTQVGRPVKVDFLIGTNTLVDRTGILLGVGINYILINEIETDDVVACDFYNIKFIKFFY